MGTAVPSRRRVLVGVELEAASKVRDALVDLLVAEEEAAQAEASVL